MPAVTCARPSMPSRCPHRRARPASLLHRGRQGRAARRTPRCPCTAGRHVPSSRELCVVANFVEVWLARQGHDHPVGINYLEKIQFPHLASIYGALLAGVDYILMGAGIP